MNRLNLRRLTSRLAGAVARISGLPTRTSCNQPQALAQQAVQDLELCSQSLKVASRPTYTAHSGYTFVAQRVICGVPVTSMAIPTKRPTANTALKFEVQPCRKQAGLATTRGSGQADPGPITASGRFTAQHPMRGFIKLCHAARVPDSSGRSFGSPTEP